jgi:hypothetical protein
MECENPSLWNKHNNQLYGMVKKACIVKASNLPFLWKLSVTGKSLVSACFMRSA